MSLPRPTLALFTLLLPLAAPAAESVEEITSTHYAAMLEDLKVYIEARPEAEDIGSAYENAVQAAFMADKPDVVLKMLGMQFDHLKKQDPLPAQQLAQTGMMRVQFAQQHGDTGVIKEVHAAFKELAESHDDQVLTQVTGMLEGMLNKPSVGDTPEMSGTTLDGEEIALEDYRGKVVMLDFWATWCGPCVAELPNVKEVYQKYHDQGFEIIGVSLDRSKEALTDFIDDKDIAWPNLLDSEQEASLADKFAVNSIPSIFLLNREGEIVAVDPRGPRLEKEVAKLMEGE